MTNEGHQVVAGILKEIMDNNSSALEKFAREVTKIIDNPTLLELVKLRDGAATAAATMRNGSTRLDSVLSALRMAHETRADMANKEPKASTYKSAPSTKSSSSYLPAVAAPSPRVARRAYNPKKSVETESVSSDFTTVAPPPKVISDEGVSSGIQSGSVTPVGGSTPSKPSGSATVTPSRTLTPGSPAVTPASSAGPGSGTASGIAGLKNIVRKRPYAPKSSPSASAPSPSE